MLKSYVEPVFVVIASDEQNKVFCAGSGLVSASLVGNFGTMSAENGLW